MTVANSFAGRNPKSKSHDYKIADVCRHCMLYCRIRIFVKALECLEMFNTFAHIHSAVRQYTYGKTEQS